MNERIKEIAIQAGLQNTLGCFWQSSDDAIERFAELVRQDEREACAKLCEKYADVLDPLQPESVCADYFQGGVKSAARRNAQRIRARGEK